MYKTILVDTVGDITGVTLNRPEGLHALDATMRGEIRSALLELNAREGTRAIVLTGAGEKAFCAGQDLRETERLATGDAAADWAKAWHGFLTAIREMDKPLVTASASSIIWCRRKGLRARPGRSRRCWLPSHPTPSV